MNLFEIIITSVAVVFHFLFPLWVGIHAWRKNHKTLAIVIYVSFLVPFLPVLIALTGFFIAKPYKLDLDYISNPVRYIGCGTAFYGASKRQNDGSFISTVWFTFLYIPLLPIQSYRVSRGGSRSSFQGYIISESTNFSVFESPGLFFPQVIRMYLFMVLYFFIIGFIFFNQKDADTGFTFLMTVTIPYLILGYFLFRAK